MSVKGYKAYEKGMICRGKQYEENATYEESGNEICESGVMHFCKEPFDVLNYYPLVDEDGNISEFSEVEAVGDVYEKEDKCATNKLHVGLKLGLKGFIKACVDFTIEKTRFTCDGSGKNDNKERNAQIGSSGDSAKIGSSGYYAKIGSSGDSAQIGSSGYSAQIESEGKHSVIMAAGMDSVAKAKIGSWITLAEWERKNENDNSYLIPVCVKTECVDGEKIKEDTFYRLKNGEFVELE